MLKMRPRHDETVNEHGPSPGAKRARAVAGTARRGQQMQIDCQGQDALLITRSGGDVEMWTTDRLH